MKSSWRIKWAYKGEQVFERTVDAFVNLCPRIQSFTGARDDKEGYKARRMANQIPHEPKIYHIVHVDRLASIIAGGLSCDAEVVRRAAPGTTIGMNAIK